MLLLLFDSLALRMLFVARRLRRLAALAAAAAAASAPASRAPEDAQRVIIVGDTREQAEILSTADRVDMEEAPTFSVPSVGAASPKLLNQGTSTPTPAAVMASCWAWSRSVSRRHHRQW